MLNASLVDTVTTHLGVRRGAADLAALGALLDAYTRTVPWESASRIVRRMALSDAAACPRLPEEFWERAVRDGTGGTCFETNYAFAALLNALGYHTTLTINDMNETRGCHTAIVVHLEGARWLIDPGFAVHAPLRLDDAEVTRAEHPVMTYSARPEPHARFRIERTPHPAPYCYTLIAHPVDDAAYRAATIRDYEPGGLFLDKVVINKVVEGWLWRFNSAERPWCLEQFVGGEPRRFTLGETPEAAAEQIGAHFRMPAGILAEALVATAASG